MENKPASTKSASEWHSWIAFEMKTPVLPEGADPKVAEEITNQREKHETFAKVLKRIASAEGTSES